MFAQLKQAKQNTNKNTAHTHIARKISKNILGILGLCCALYIPTSLAAVGTVAEQKAAKACNSGDIKSCNELANHYLSLQKYKEASDYLTKICYSNSPDAEKTCAALTTLLLEPAYNINNYQHGVEIAEYLCNHNNSYGCVMLSVVYSSGNFIPKDLQKAEDYARRACQLNDKTGCNQLGILTYTLAFSLQNIELAEEAFGYFKQACDLGDQSACEEFSQYNSKMEQFKQFKDNVAAVQQQVQQSQQAQQSQPKQ